MDNATARLLSRKFILSVLSLVSVSVLVYLGTVADGVYSTIVIATVGAYITGNVIQNNTVPK